MMDPQISTAPAVTRDVARERTLFADVYTWMMVGLLTCGGVAWYVTQSVPLYNLIATNFKAVSLGLVFYVWVLNFTLWRFSATAATIQFLVYAVVEGAVLGVLLPFFTGATVHMAFLATAGTFGAMSLYGRLTNTDLSRMGSIFWMALVGLVIASVINVYTKNSGMNQVILYGAVILYTGLTAYYTQMIRQMSYQVDAASEMGRKIAVFGALALMIAVISIFVSLLQLFSRRN